MQYIHLFNGWMAPAITAAMCATVWFVVNAICFAVFRQFPFGNGNFFVDAITLPGALQVYLAQAADSCGIYNLESTSFIFTSRMPTTKSMLVFILLQALAIWAVVTLGLIVSGAKGRDDGDTAGLDSRTRQS